MTWLQRYHLRGILRGSLWLMPTLSIVAVLLVAPLVRWVDHLTDWTWFDYTPDGARAVLSAFAASMLTFVVFVVTSMLIVVQLASAQLTPRIIAKVFSGTRVKIVLSFFTFTYTYTVAAAARIEDATPQLPVVLAILLNLACLAVFFWFAQELGGSLRPIAVLVEVAREGRKVIESVYPEPFDPAEKPPPSRPPSPLGTQEIVHAGPSGVVMAFSHKDLKAIAEKVDGTIELVPQVGDFLALGDPLFRVSGGAIDADALRDCVAIGAERTLEQDPRFALRIMVDIANKALSPAINDPTTAVLALDQIHRLLMYVGKRRLDAGEVHDAQGRLRLVYGTPDWGDFVTLAVTEIRHYGAGSLQVVRRLRALLEHLQRVLPEPRHAALQQELQLLQKAAHRFFADEEDRARAAVGDLQGIGGSESS